MGQHTWFEKDKELYLEAQMLYEQMDKHYYNQIYLEEEEIWQIENRLNEIDALNEAEFHDCFRTSKRESDSSYTTDVILSKKEFDKWIIENQQFIHDMNIDRVNEFWEKYPNGVIYFG